jgi:hypothetical protein
MFINFSFYKNYTSDINTLVIIKRLGPSKMAVAKSDCLKEMLKLYSNWVSHLFGFISYDCRIMVPVEGPPPQSHQTKTIQLFCAVVVLIFIYKYTKFIGS